MTRSAVLLDEVSTGDSHRPWLFQEGLEAPPEEDEPLEAADPVDDDEDLSFATMFNSMRLEEADEPSQAAKPRNISAAISELDPVVTYGSFGQVIICAHLHHFIQFCIQLRYCTLKWCCSALYCNLGLMCSIRCRTGCLLETTQHTRPSTVLHPLALLVYCLATMTCHAPQRMTCKAAALPQLRGVVTPCMVQKH